MSLLHRKYSFHLLKDFVMFEYVICVATLNVMVEYVICLATLNERFRHCLSMSKMLNAENILSEAGIDPSDTTLTADR